MKAASRLLDRCLRLAYETGAIRLAIEDAKRMKKDRFSKMPRHRLEAELEKNAPKRRLLKIKLLSSAVLRDILRGNRGFEG